MTYWQHDTPLKCPKGHRMYWLGGAFWLCPKEHCHQVFVAQWVQP